MPSADAKPKSLSATFVSAAKAPGKYHDGKGTGLFLLVKPTGGGLGPTADGAREAPGTGARKPAGRKSR